MIGRDSELKNLNSYYERNGSQILVLYGQKHIGVHSLIREFLADKPSLYYLARPCSEREQQYQWGQQLAVNDVKTLKFPTFTELFSAIIEQGSGKLVLVIDEFSNIVKVSDSFMDEMVRFIHNQWNKRQVMVILASSAVGWIENSMVEKIGESAYELSGLMKIRELSFYEMVRSFKGFSMEQCIEAYSVLGGYPELWEQFDDRLSIKENIIRKIIEPGSFLHSEAIQLVEENLRETSVYNSILAAIASGKNKLNDLYEHTDFSRAKISVYLKNLMELELVEKVFSYDTAGKANVQKGIYRISNHFVHFYFTFLYCHMSEWQMMSSADFYKTFIAPNLKRYVGVYYKQICAQNLEMRNSYGQLPFVYDRSGEWVGKVGNIDLIAQNEEGKTLICLCNWEKPMMTYDDYEWLLFCVKKAKIEADYIFLYSGKNFDEKLTLEAKVKPNLKLIPASQL